MNGPINFACTGTFFNEEYPETVFNSLLRAIAVFVENDFQRFNAAFF
jgi:hypothetical protein